VCGYAPTTQQFGSMLGSYPQLSPVGWGLSRNIRVPGRRFDQRKTLDWTNFAIPTCGATLCGVGPSCRVSLVRLSLLLPYRNCFRSTGRAARFRLEHIRGSRGSGRGISILLPRDDGPARGGGRDILWRTGRTASRLGSEKDRRASARSCTDRKPGARRCYDPLRTATARTGTD